MELLGIILISPLWGILSPRLFLQSWLSFLAILATLIFLFQARSQYKAFFLLFCRHFTDMLFNFILLMAGFYILYYHLPFGASGAEALLYWIFSSIQLALILPTVSRRIDQMLAKVRGISQSAQLP